MKKIWIFVDGEKLAVLNLEDLMEKKEMIGFCGRGDVYLTEDDELPKPLRPESPLNGRTFGKKF